MQKQISPDAFEAVPPQQAAGAAVGARIRELRRRKGLRLAELAAQTGLSIGYLSQIERGISSPTVRVLTVVAAPLGVTYADLFRQTPTQAGDDLVIVRRDARQSLGIWRSGVEKHLLSPPGASRLNLYEVTLEPGGASGDAYYAHEGEEAGIVLQGELQLTVEDRTWRLKKGDSFRFLSNRPHRFLNPGRSVARVVWVNVADPA